jgi:hypothetical protein
MFDFTPRSNWFTSVYLHYWYTAQGSNVNGIEDKHSRDLEGSQIFILQANPHPLPLGVPERHEGRSEQKSDRCLGFSFWKWEEHLHIGGNVFS